MTETTKAERKRARIAAMTPEQRKEYDQQQAERKARKKARKAARKAAAKVAVSKATVKAASFTDHEDKEAIKAMNASALRNHNLNSSKAQDAIKSAGDNYRDSVSYRIRKSIKQNEQEHQKQMQRVATKKQPYTYQLKSVKGLKGSELLLAHWWNDAVNQRLNPHDYIDDKIKQVKAERLAAQTKALGDSYQPEIKPADTGRKYRVVNGVVEYY